MEPFVFWWKSAPSRPRKRPHTSVILSESAGAKATKGESKDPGNIQFLNADAGSSHECLVLWRCLLAHHPIVQPQKRQFPQRQHVIGPDRAFLSAVNFDCFPQRLQISGAHT